MPDFLPKQQLGVQGIPAKRVQDLGADIMNLFGNVGKAVKTYDTIGETSAILEFQEQSIQASDRLTEQKILLNRAAEMNDVETMTAVKANIDAITTDVMSKRDNFSNHKAAYEAYNSRASDFGARVRSTYHPSVDAAIVRSTKANRVSYNNEIMNKYAESSMPISTASFSDSQKINKDSYFSEQEQQAFKSQVFTHNASLLSSALTSAPEEMVRKYSLISPDKKGGLSYSYKNEKVMLDEVFGDAYTIDDAGMVVPTKANTSPDAQEMAMLSGTLKRFRSMFAMENGSAYNARMQSDLNEAKQIMSDERAGNLPVGSLYSSEAYNRLRSGTYQGTASKSQQNQLDVFGFDAKKHDVKMNAAVGLVEESFKTENPVAVNKAMVDGYKGVSASVFRAIVDNKKESMNNALTQQLRSGEFNKVAKEVSDNTKKFTLMFGQSPEVVQKARSAVYNGSLYVDATTYKNSLILEKEMLSKGLVSIDASGSIADLKIKKQLDLIEVAEDSFKQHGDVNRFNADVYRIRSSGRNETIVLATNNLAKISNLNAENLNAWFNLGNTKDLTYSEKESIALWLAEKGEQISGDNDQLIDLTAKYFTRVQDRDSSLTGMIGGTAQYVPKTMTNDQYETVKKNMRDYASNTETLSDDDTKYRYSIINGSTKDGKEVYIVKMYNEEKKLMASEIFDVSTLKYLEQ
jgi:hypothetical protein